MKRITHLSTALALLIIVFAGCSTTKNLASTNSTSSSNTTSASGDVRRGRFVGTWTINSVTNENIVGNTVKRVFDQAPPDAFVGSKWQLTNSGNGAYTLSDGTSQSIYWSFYNPGNGAEPMFQFKKVYQGDQAKNVDSGYRLVISNADGTAMTLKTPVDLGNGTTGYVVYQFTKTK